MNNPVRNHRTGIGVACLAALAIGAAACGGSVSDDQASVVLVDDETTTTDPTTATDSDQAGSDEAGSDEAGSDEGESAGSDAGDQDDSTGAATTESSTTTSSSTTTTAAVPAESLVERVVPTNNKCSYAIYSPDWILDDEIRVLGETYTGPVCRLDEKWSATEFDLGAQFTSATVSVAIDEGVWPSGDRQSASDAQFEVQFLEISGATETELHPTVDLSLGKPVTVELDVTGIARLHVRFTYISGGAGNVSVYDGELRP